MLNLIKLAANPMCGKSALINKYKYLKPYKARGGQGYGEQKLIKTLKIVLGVRVIENKCYYKSYKARGGQDYRQQMLLLLLICRFLLIC